MRVGIITERYPPNIKGGGEVSVSLLAQGLRARGIDVRILSFDGKGETVEDGVPVRRLKPAESLHFPVEKSNLLAYPDIKEFSRERDLIHGYNMRYYPATVRACSVLGLPSVLTMTTYGFYYPHHVDGLEDPGSLLGKVHQRITDGAARGMIARDASALLALSRAQKEIYEEAGFPASKLFVIPNFVDPYFLEEGVERPSHEFKKILYVGRLSPEKGLDTLMKAYAIERSLHPGLTLALAGTGPHLQALRSLAGELGILEGVEFLGKLSYRETREVYRRASIFVHPAVWPEPFGRSVLEAMASALPVIASRTGSAPELLAGAGLLFEPGNSEELASRIEELLRDRGLARRLSEAGKERAASEYSPERMLDKILSLYGRSIKAFSLLREIDAAAARERAARKTTASSDEGGQRELILVRERRLRRLRHRCGRFLDRTVAPFCQKIVDAYYRILRGTGKSSGQAPQRIVVMMFTRGIGDALLVSPALNALRRKHPRSFIAVVGTPYVGDLVGRFRSVDQFIPFPVEHANLSATYRLVRKLRALRFETAIDILPDRSVLSAIISFFTGARDVVGFSVGLRSIFFSCRHTAEFYGIHFADLVRGMIAQTGFGASEWCGFESELSSAAEEESAASRLSGLKRPLVCVHPGSRDVKDLRWPPDNWVTLVSLLRERYGVGVVLIGYGAERALCRYIEERAGEGALNLSGRCTIGETAAVIREADLLLCAPSGPLHMAVALGAPAVYVAGGADLVRWRAHGDDSLHKAVLRTRDCRPELCRSCSMRFGQCAESTSVESVLDEVDKMIRSLDLTGLKAR